MLGDSCTSRSGRSAVCLVVCAEAQSEWMLSADWLNGATVCQVAGWRAYLLDRIGSSESHLRGAVEIVEEAVAGGCKAALSSDRRRVFPVVGRVTARIVDAIAKASSAIQVALCRASVSSLACEI